MNSAIGALTIGSDIYLPLRTVGEHHDTHVSECHLGILPIGSDVPDIEDLLCWGCLCLGLCIGHYLVGFVMILSSGVCVYIPFV